MEKCPFCQVRKSSPYTLKFRCGTTGIQHLSQITWQRVDTCYKAQISALQQANQELREALGEAEKLLKPLERFTGLLAGPGCSWTRGQMEDLNKGIQDLLPTINRLTKE